MWLDITRAGLGEEALEAGREQGGVTLGLVRSGWETEVVQTRLERRDSFLWGKTGWLSWGRGWRDGISRLGRETDTLP